jgi:N-acetylglutamate synthase-like GNAT family acetyltransferase
VAAALLQAAAQVAGLSLMGYNLIIVRAPEEWDVYHCIRRMELFGARGRIGIYDSNHPDEYLLNHFPLLLQWEGQGIGTTRLDVRDGGLAVVRLVAITKTLQRKGHGRVLAGCVEAFAREKQVSKLLVNAASDAVGFYERIGFVRESWDPTELVGWNVDSIQMAKSLGG